jgi:hypothetical protein
MWVTPQAARSLSGSGAGAGVTPSHVRLVPAFDTYVYAPNDLRRPTWGCTQHASAKDGSEYDNWWRRHIPANGFLSTFIRASYWCQLTLEAGVLS